MSDSNFPPPDSGAENLEREIKEKVQSVNQLLTEIEVILSTYIAKAEGNSEKLAHATALIDGQFNPEDGDAIIEPWYDRMLELLGEYLRLFHQSEPTEEQTHKLLLDLGFEEGLVDVLVGVLGTEVGRLVDEDDEEVNAVFDVPRLDQ